MRGLICKDIENLDFGTGAFIWSRVPKQMDKGIGNSESLIADTYHVLFVNYFCDTYVFETLDKLRKRKDIYRFQTKKYINEGFEFIKNYEKKLLDRMGADYADKFSSMNINLQDAMQKDLNRLEESVVKAYKEKNSKDAELFAKIQLSIMLLELSRVNTTDRINENIGINPAASNIKWTYHIPLYHSMRKIDELLKCEDVSRDIIIRDRWIKLQKKWYNVDFIADNMTDQQEKESEESKELRQIIKTSL